MGGGGFRVSDHSRFSPTRAHFDAGGVRCISEWCGELRGEAMPREAC